MTSTTFPKHALHLLALTAIAIAPAQAQTGAGVKPSRTSAYLDGLRQHANDRLADRDRARGEDANAGRRQPGFQAETEVDPGVRNQAYQEAIGELGMRPEPSENSIYDDVYNRALTARYPAFSRADYSTASGDRYGRENAGYSYSQPERTSYFPEPVRSQDRNFNLGLVDVRFGISTFAEYNDNILASSTNKIEDVVIGTLIDLGGSWQLTEGNRIDLDLGLGIERYLSNQDQIATSNEEFNLIVTPNSAVSFDIFLGDVLLNLHDRFSVINRGRDQFTLDDLELFSQWTNEVGASLYFPLSAEIDLSIGYDYATTRSLEDRNEYLDRNAHQIFASTSYSPDQAWRIGLQSSASFTSYVLPIQNDVDSYNAGIFLETPLTQFTNIRFDGGYQIMAFSASGTAPPRDDHGDFYGSLSINNQLNKYFNHSLAIGHESSSGILSDVTVVDYARYSFRLDTLRDQSIGGSVFYEMDQESGGTFQEDTDRFGTELHYNILLTKDLALGLGGHYGVTDSALGGRDYDRWGASVDLSYALSNDLALGLRYAHHNTSSDTGTQNYQQNRVILNLNYHF